MRATKNDRILQLRCRFTPEIKRGFKFFKFLFKKLKTLVFRLIMYYVYALMMPGIAGYDDEDDLTGCEILINYYLPLK